MKLGQKHFVDTSIARPMVHGTTEYKRYLNGEISENRYVSPFVGMEFRRSLIQSLIHFHTVLSLQSIQTVGDAFKLISQSYASSELKASLTLAAGLFDLRGIGQNDQSSKQKALHAVADIIIRMNALFEGLFKNHGQDATRCARATVELKAKPETASEDFERFSEKFQDTDFCRSQCSVDVFFQKNKAAVESYVQLAKQSKKTADNAGFQKITENLERILAKGGSACSCSRCERVGDAIIALDAPREMQLEHLDKSFDYLCPPIKQPHRKHLSETAFHFK